MSWLRRLPSVVVFTGLAGLLVAACTTDPGGLLTAVKVDLGVVGPGVVQATNPETGFVTTCSGPVGFDCGFTFPDAGRGGGIAVTAIPDAGAVLQSWTVGCPGSTATVCDLVFSTGGGDVTISGEATFVAAPPSARMFSDDFEGGCGNWTVTASGGTAGGTNIKACRSSGGISGSGYREMEHQLGMGSMSVEHTFTGGSLVVGRGSGAMCAATVRFQEQRIITTAAFTGAAVGAWVWIKQDGVRFDGPVVAFTNTSWGNYDTGDLTAAQFSPGLDLCPVTSSTLTFGINRSNSNNGATPITMVHGIDDWSVTIVPGPLPTP